jgi:hypothetical protein
MTLAASADVFKWKGQTPSVHYKKNNICVIDKQLIVSKVSPILHTSGKWLKTCFLLIVFAIFDFQIFIKQYH